MDGEEVPGVDVVGAAVLTDDGDSVAGTAVAVGDADEGATVPEPGELGDDVGVFKVVGVVAGESEVEHNGFGSTQITPPLLHSGTLKQASLGARPGFPVRSMYAAPARIRSPTSVAGNVEAVRLLLIMLILVITFDDPVHTTLMGAVATWFLWQSHGACLVALHLVQRRPFVASKKRRHAVAPGTVTPGVGAVVVEPAVVGAPAVEGEAVPAFAQTG